MGYLNPVEIRGAARFAADAAAAGVDGVLLVDLPPEEAGDLRAALTAHGLALILLASPTTADARLRAPVRGCAGLSVLRQLRRRDRRRPARRRRRRRPPARDPRQRAACRCSPASASRTPPPPPPWPRDADGVVVGSALVAALADAADPAAAARAASSRRCARRWTRTRLTAAAALNCRAAPRIGRLNETDHRMSWLKKLMPSRIRTEGGNKRSVPEGLWEKCDRCGAVLYRPELEENLEVCPKCSHHMPIRARARLASLFDADSMREIGAELGPTDVLKFKDQKKYSDRIKAAQKSTGERDALVAMQGTLKGRDLVAASFDFAYMGGSMGSVVGERFARAAESALELRLPVRVLLRQRRRAHAGKPVLADADGQDLGRARAPARGGLAVHLGDDPSDHRRRVGVVRDAGRHQPGRTRGADRLRRPARDRADRAREAAGRLPALRIPARARRDRPDLRPPRAARPHRAPAGADDEAAAAAGRRGPRVRREHA